MKKLTKKLTKKLMIINVPQRAKRAKLITSKLNTKRETIPLVSRFAFIICRHVDEYYRSRSTTKSM